MMASSLYVSLLGVAKRYTLPLGMLSGTALYLLFTRVAILQPAGEILGPVVETLMPVMLSAVLLLTFYRTDFSALRIRLWHIAVCLVQITISLLITATAHYFTLSNPTTNVLLQSLLCCIIAPGAAATAVITAKLGGSLEDTITFTMLNNALAAITIPICFPLVAPDVHINFLTASAQILLKVFLVLVVPMVIARAMRGRVGPRLHHLLSIPDAAFYLWGVNLAVATGITVSNIIHATVGANLLVGISILSLLICIIQFAIGRTIGHKLGVPIESGQGLGQKNTAFAIWIAHSFLNPISAVGPGCYILWQNSVNSLELWRHDKQKKKL